jgi:hypothetical protein
LAVKEQTNELGLETVHETVTNKTDMAFGEDNVELTGQSDLMVADTGASCHVFTDATWMTDVVANHDSTGICVGDSVVKHEGRGCLPVTFLDNEGKVGAQVKLKDVHLSKKFGSNLFSLTKAKIRSGDDQHSIIVSNNGVEIHFDVTIKLGLEGCYFALESPPTNRHWMQLRRWFRLSPVLRCH